MHSSPTLSVDKDRHLLGGGEWIRLSCGTGRLAALDCPRQSIHSRSVRIHA